MKTDVCAWTANSDLQNIVRVRARIAHTVGRIGRARVDGRGGRRNERDRRLSVAALLTILAVLELHTQVVQIQVVVLGQIGFLLVRFDESVTHGPVNTVQRGRISGNQPILDQLLVVRSTSTRRAHRERIQVTGEEEHDLVERLQLLERRRTLLLLAGELSVCRLLCIASTERTRRTRVFGCRDLVAVPRGTRVARVLGGEASDFRTDTGATRPVVRRDVDVRAATDRMPAHFSAPLEP